MAVTARVQFRPGPLRQLTRTGPVRQYHSRVAEEVAKLARSNAKGRVKRAIKTRYRSDLKNPAIEVYIDKDLAPWGLYYHEGTRPHRIEAKNVDFLRFEWPSGPAELRSDDGFFYFAGVNHPGTKPHPILTDAAQAVGLRVRKLHR